jgi:hypothetical protein
VVSIKNIWFWFTLTVCPILILVGIYTLGHIIGFSLFSKSDELVSLDTSQIVFILCGFSSLFVFLKTLKVAKSRFAKKYN